MDLATLIEQRRTIRVIGFDDGPFVRGAGQPVAVAGVVCAGTRFEGMLWGAVQPDGWDATDAISTLLLNSKFHAQVHLVLLDGISMAGFNIIDLSLLAARSQRPCIAVMRRLPNFTKIAHAVTRLPDPTERLEMMRRAGTIHQHPPFYFQVCGAEPEIAAIALDRLTDRGHVPEALRIAHLVTAAVIKGESGKQA
ncbi:MAG: DUF99 family protein [Leptolyngbyaceae cyanobacterium bins.349]|nr:DUF99 family protein [Leptolyngbyaceae cyanobacterium bins.349]